jgi:hypothetical protein
MDTQTVLAFAGIAATLVVGIWAIIVTVRYNRNVRITYALDQAIALTDDITQNFPDLRISFRDEPISQNLVLLKGYLINTGKKDISREMVEERITLVLKKDYEWVECKVVETSPSLKVSAAILDLCNVSFETGLWKTKEYLKFEALAKVPVMRSDAEATPVDHPTVRLRKALSFKHRIADSTRIIEMKVPRRYGSVHRHAPFMFARPVRMYFVMGTMMLILGSGLWVINQFRPLTAIGYSIELDGQKRIVNAKARKNKIVLSDDHGFKKAFTLAEFDALPRKESCLVRSMDRATSSLGLTYAGIGALILLIIGIRSFKENRFLAMIANKGKP